MKRIDLNDMDASSMTGRLPRHSAIQGGSTYFIRKFGGRIVAVWAAAG